MKSKRRWRRWEVILCMYGKVFPVRPFFTERGARSCAEFMNWLCESARADYADAPIGYEVVRR